MTDDQFIDACHAAGLTARRRAGDLFDVARHGDPFDGHTLVPAIFVENLAVRLHNFEAAPVGRRRRHGPRGPDCDVCRVYPADSAVRVDGVVTGAVERAVDSEPVPTGSRWFRR